MNAAMRALIHQYQDHAYTTAGLIWAIFIDTGDAHDCAAQIKSLVDGLQVLSSQFMFLD